MAERLAQYKDNDSVIVLGLPRGGVCLADEVAKVLRAPMDLLLVRKLGTPQNPEVAMGAIALPSTHVMNQDVIQSYGLSKEDIDCIIAREEKVLHYRNELYRENKPQPDVRNKIVILVDDGIATGADMRAAITAIKAQHPEKIVVAVPIAPEDALPAIRALADEVLCLNTPSPFLAVGQGYWDFEQVSDDEVIAVMKAFGL